MKAGRTPRYEQLKAGILKQIASGALRPGDRVPSENELVESAGVSRMTANRALRELNNEGVVERITGSGTFVSKLKATSHPLEVRDIAEEVAQRGHAWSAEVLTQERCPADRRVADALQLRLRQNVFHVRLVHREDGLRDVPPVGIEASMKLFEYYAGMLAERRKRPSDDLTSALLNAEDESGRMTDAEITAFLFLMVVAGNETTTKLLGNSLFHLSQHPAQLAEVLADREGGLVDAWVEETLMLSSSAVITGFSWKSSSRAVSDCSLEAVPSTGSRCASSCSSSRRAPRLAVTSRIDWLARAPKAAARSPKPLRSGASRRSMGCAGRLG